MEKNEREKSGKFIHLFSRGLRTFRRLLFFVGIIIKKKKNETDVWERPPSAVLRRTLLTSKCSLVPVQGLRSIFFSFCFVVSSANSRPQLRDLL